MSEPIHPTTDRQASHTPGPWSNERIWDTPASRIHARVEGIPVALAEVFSMRNVGEKEANARLIAAAPELLEALKLMYAEEADYIRLNNLGDVHHNRRMQLARDAIAKAEGRS